MDELLLKLSADRKEVEFREATVQTLILKWRQELE